MADPGEEPGGGGGGPLILRPLPRFLRVWMTGRPPPSHGLLAFRHIGKREDRGDEVSYKYTAAK